MTHIRAAIIGPTSYTGFHLIELLLRHPNATVTYLASHREQLPNIADEFPKLKGRCDLDCQPIDAAAIAATADIAFLCLPHVASMRYAPALIEAGLRVVDLSADYRLNDKDVYQRVYDHTHEDAGRLATAVYGLPEFFEDEIKSATLVANPGCYPTAAALGIAPLLKAGLAKPTGIIINAASGVSGAGRNAKPHLHFPEVDGGFSSYAPGLHRHQIEIEQTLSTVTGSTVSTLFVPHLLPITQGIFETIYLEPVQTGLTQSQLHETFENAYADKPFVRVRKELPNIKHVVNTNYVDIAVRLVNAGGEPGAATDQSVGQRIIVFSTEDNVIKGASGQAVQNMNLMFGLDQTTSLA
jgi:N-acetyl-gamma-glutamyl-phosphate reductase